MSRTNLFFKVEVDHDSDERPERIADEIRLRLLRIYGVRDVEVSNIASADDE